MRKVSVLLLSVSSPRPQSSPPQLSLSDLYTPSSDQLGGAAVFGGRFLSCERCLESSSVVLRALPGGKDVSEVRYWPVGPCGDALPCSQFSAWALAPCFPPYCAAVPHRRARAVSDPLLSAAFVSVVLSGCICTVVNAMISFYMYAVATHARMHTHTDTHSVRSSVFFIGSPVLGHWGCSWNCVFRERE